MGDLRVILKLIGVLPIEIPDLKKSNFKRIFPESHYGKLQSLIGKEVSISDFHYGSIKGSLVSIDDSDNYSIHTSEGIKKFHIHDIGNLAA